MSIFFFFKHEWWLVSRGDRNMTKFQGIICNFPNLKEVNVINEPTGKMEKWTLDLLDSEILVQEETAMTRNIIADSIL